MRDNTAKCGAVIEFFNVYKNVNEILKDRGYDVLVAGTVLATLEEFKKRFSGSSSPCSFDRSAMNFICQNDKKLVMVYFSNEISIGKKDIEDIHGKMKIGKIFHCILVYPKQITSSAVKHIPTMTKYRIETFADDDLIINITKHNMMPKFHVLLPEEKEVLFAETNLRGGELSRISLNDPIAKYYGMVRGDIVKITRKSQTAGLYITFRICN